MVMTWRKKCCRRRRGDSGTARHAIHRYRDIATDDTRRRCRSGKQCSVPPKKRKSGGAEAENSALSRRKKERAAVQKRKTAFCPAEKRKCNARTVLLCRRLHQFQSIFIASFISSVFSAAFSWVTVPARSPVPMAPAGPQ